MLKLFKQLPWIDFLLVFGLALFDLSIHPLTGGPDRLIHDPAVNRINDPTYLPGDWYTDMAVRSGVYPFYAKLIHVGSLIGVPEELWRSLLYLIGLAVLYYALIRIARLFTSNPFVVPMLVIIHALFNTGANQPTWLYGPFIQVDGGLAPRTLGVAVSFLALLFLMRRSLVIPALLLGLATLVHVSNSLIIFTLMGFAWLGTALITNYPRTKSEWLNLSRIAGSAIGVYLLMGGWFAFYVALENREASLFSSQQFIWSWVYLRASYMALPLVSDYWWIRFFAHVAAIIVGWYLLRKRTSSELWPALDTVAFVGIGAVAYFYLFYLFAFIWPWLPGFQFYSIRVVYFAYFVAYLFMSLLFFFVARDFISAILPLRVRYSISIVPIMAFVTVGSVLGTSVIFRGTYRQPEWQNLKISWWRIVNASGSQQQLVPEVYRTDLPPHATYHYLLEQGKPFLGPPVIDAPTWKKSPHYLPHVASFKSFGFTAEGLPQWFQRLDDVSGGQILTLYTEQQRMGIYQPVEIDWEKAYRKLDSQQVLALAARYNFELFLTYSDVIHPFAVVAEDEDFRLYSLPKHGDGQ